MDEHFDDDGGYSPQSLSALAELITGGPGGTSSPPIGIYRTGRQIVSFFRSLNYDFELGVQSRVPFTENCLWTINRMEEGDIRIGKVIDRLFDPRDYFEDEDALARMVEYLNQYLDLVQVRTTCFEYSGCPHHLLR